MSHQVQEEEEEEELQNWATSIHDLPVSESDESIIEDLLASDDSIPDAISIPDDSIPDVLSIPDDSIPDALPTLDEPVTQQSFDNLQIQPLTPDPDQSIEQVGIYIIYITCTVLYLH